METGEWHNIYDSWLGPENRLPQDWSVSFTDVSQVAEQYVSGNEKQRTILYRKYTMFFSLNVSAGLS